MSVVEYKVYGVEDLRGVYFRTDSEYLKKTEKNCMSNEHVHKYDNFTLKNSFVYYNFLKEAL